jgi:hypothetical protein
MPDRIPPKLPGDSSPTSPALRSKIAVLSTEPIIDGAVPSKRVTRRHHPLPDAVAIHSIAVPQTAPPYDDDQPAAGRTALDASAPSHRTAISGSARGGAAALTDAPSQADVAAEKPERHSPTHDPAGHWPSQFAQALAETLAGSRPPSQIAPWTTEQARRRIGQLGPMLATAHRPRVKRVVVTSPTGGVLEMAIVVILGTRVRALAVRLERARPPDPGIPPESAPSAEQDLPAQLTAQPGPAGRPKASSRSNPAASWVCTAIEAA